MTSLCVDERFSTVCLPSKLSLSRRISLLLYEMFTNMQEMLRSCWARDQPSCHFCNCEGLHTKERQGCCCTIFLFCFVIQCCFFDSHVGCNHQLVGVWSEHQAFILQNENCENFFWRDFMHFHKICISKITRYTCAGFSLGFFQRVLCSFGALICHLGLLQNHNI